MNTAVIYNYNPNESGSAPTDYQIPEHVPLDSTEGSISNQDEDELTTIENPTSDVLPTPIRLAPPLSPLKGRFTLLQMWEGNIVEVRNSEFDAIIIDRTNPDLSNELVTIDKFEISPDDNPLIKRGSVFYWSIGYSDYPGRGRIRESKIRFRRLKGWTEKEINHSKKIGKEFAEFFKSYSE
ncbi:MAG: hypothetical protein WBN77_11690 [Desulfobacterales bacterium]